MLYRKLGRVGWYISEISLGSYGTFDVAKENRTGRENVLAVIRAAIDHGVNLIDTANMYGNSEDAIGEALTLLREGGIIEYGVPFDPQRKRPRPHLFIATKTWASSLKEATRQIRNSFKVLRTEYIIRTAS
ncbi:MAG: aldo/keto reductase [Candidatus Helarchaeota archaeon]